MTSGSLSTSNLIALAGLLVTLLGGGAVGVSKFTRLITVIENAAKMAAAAVDAIVKIVDTLAAHEDAIKAQASRISAVEAAAGIAPAAPRTAPSSPTPPSSPASAAAAAVIAANAANAAAAVAVS